VAALAKEQRGQDSAQQFGIELALATCGWVNAQVKTFLCPYKSLQIYF